MEQRFSLVIFVLSLGTLQACFSGKGKYEAIRVRGSDSEVNLVQALAEQFMDRDSFVSIGVTGGGSGAGIAALINHKTDLANSSRVISAEELQFAHQRDVDPYPVIFAHDALAVIVHPSNPVDSLTLEDIGKLYSGNIDNWKGAGGADDRVTRYGRQSSSGTFIYFREAVVKAEYSLDMIGMSGTAQIVEAVKADRKGIGYVSAGYLSDNIIKDIKVLAVRAEAESPAYSPLHEDAIVRGDYPITRPLLQYTDGRPQGKLLEFIRFQFSTEGQAIIKHNGFYPVQESPL